MADIEEFSTDVAVLKEFREATAGEPFPYKFRLDGRDMRFRRPDPGEGVQLLVIVGGHNGEWSRFGAYVDIIQRVLHPDDRAWLMRRILNPEDPMSVQYPQILAGKDGQGGVMRNVVAQWGGRPTESPQPSSSESPPPTGGSSILNTQTWTS